MDKSAYSEARRDFESAGDEAGLDSINSDASQGKIFVETRRDSGLVRVNNEIRDDLRFFLTQLQKLPCFIHVHPRLASREPRVCVQYLLKYTRHSLKVKCSEVFKYNF